MPDLLRTIIGSVGILFLPGFFASYIAFPGRERGESDAEGDDSRALDPIERIVLALFLSITVASALVYAMFAVQARFPLVGPITPRRLAIAFAMVSVVLATAAAWRVGWIPFAAAMVVGGVPVIAVTVRIVRASDLTFATASAAFGVVLAATAIVIAAQRLRRSSVFRESARVVLRRCASHSFTRYCIIGAVNTLLDFSIYTVLTRGWEFWRSHYLFANAISFSIVVTWSFFWNKYWTFKNRTGRRGSQFAKFVTVTLVGVGISEAVLSIGVEAFALPDLVAKVIAAPLVVLWNFTAYRLWAFAEEKA